MYVSIDIGGTAVKYGLVDSYYNFVHKGKKDTNADLGMDQLIHSIKDIVKYYIDKKYDIEGVGISSAGIVNPIEGDIIYSGKQIPKYAGTNWKKIIESAFYLPCEVENDVNCVALSEAISGNGADASHVLCLTIGTGVGAGFVQNKEIYHGYSNFACEVGYMNMRESTFQELASTTALVSNVANIMEIPINELDGEKIFALAKKGDRICIEQIDLLLDHLAYGIANITYILNPEMIILGGGIMEQQDYLRDRFYHAMRRYSKPDFLGKTKIEFAKHKNDAGMLGAIYNLRKVTVV